MSFIQPLNIISKRTCLICVGVKIREGSFMERGVSLNDTLNNEYMYQGMLRSRAILTLTDIQFVLIGESLSLKSACVIDKGGRCVLSPSVSNIYLVIISISLVNMEYMHL